MSYFHILQKKSTLKTYKESFVLYMEIKIKIAPMEKGCKMNRVIC